MSNFVLGSGVVDCLMSVGDEYECDPAVDNEPL